MSEIVLSDEARKLISRWARDEFYIYIRPLTSRLIDRSKPHKVYWQVSVEYRYVEYKSIRGEGYDLNQIILDLGPRVPRRKDKQPGYLGAQEKPAGEFGKKKSKKKVKATTTEEARPKKRPKEIKTKKPYRDNPDAPRPKIEGKAKKKKTKLTLIEGGKKDKPKKKKA